METNTEMRYRFVRGHGSDIFWGSLSVFFAGAACYFYFAYSDNELRARELRDQNAILTEETKTLKQQVEKLQGSASDVRVLLEARNKDLLRQKASLQDLTARAQNLSAAQAVLNEHNELKQDIAVRLRRAVQDYQDVDFISVVNRDGNWALRIENAALFEPGKLELTPAAQKILTELAKQMKPFYPTHEIQLEAFTDDDPIVGSLKKRFASNTELAAARAEVVARFLEEDGELDPDVLAVVARGERMPVLPNTTSENKAKNRRLEVSLRPRRPVAPPATAEKEPEEAPAS